MKQLHIGYNVFTNGDLMDDFLEKASYKVNTDDFNIELFGVSSTDEKLPDNFQAVYYYSRETAFIYVDGELVDDEEEIEKWENENCC